MSEVEFEDAQSSDYKYVYASGAFGAIIPSDARIIFYLERLVPKTIQEGEKKGTLITGKVVRELQVEVHMSPQEFVTLWDWMGKRLELYREQFPEFPLKMPTAKKTAKKKAKKTAKKKNNI